MPSRKVLLYGLTLLSCPLALAASGDDFCLWRLICPALLAQAGSLPLGDPNTDFLGVDNPAAAGALMCTRYDTTLPVFCVRILSPYQTCRVARCTRPFAPHPQDTEPDTPLRC